MESLKSAIEKNDSDAMKRGMEQLTQAQHKAAEALYKTAGPQSGGGPDAQGGAGPQGSAGPRCRRCPGDSGRRCPADPR